MPPTYEAILDRDLVPDWVIRRGIRKLLAKRLALEARRDAAAWRDEIRRSPLAIHTRDANEQHYELPSEFFLKVLGPHLKYSSAFYTTGKESLAEAEEAMLRLSCERARLHDGDSILELGCGWGSLSLFMAHWCPNSRIVAMSNSQTQKEFIDAQAQRRGIENLEVRTADMLSFAPGEQFQRIVSVEMFEHMRNYEELLRRVASWLKPEGTLFVHIFTHKQFAYPFETDGQDDWMAKYFFSGGQMPSEDLLVDFRGELALVDKWAIHGRHYARTCEDWLKNMDANRESIRGLFRKCYGEGEETKWITRWRVFFMACAELFAYDEGRQWGVTHYLFQKP
jgi:cyclopropane-fatty-acyl-phospholipid synthase